MFSSWASALPDSIFLETEGWLTPRWRATAPTSNRHNCAVPMSCACPHHRYRSRLSISLHTPARNAVQSTRHHMVNTTGDKETGTARHGENTQQLSITVRGSKAPRGFRREASPDTSFGYSMVGGTNQFGAGLLSTHACAGPGRSDNAPQSRHSPSVSTPPNRTESSSTARVVGFSGPFLPPS